MKKLALLIVLLFPSLSFASSDNSFQGTWSGPVTIYYPSGNENGTLTLTIEPNGQLTGKEVTTKFTTSFMGEIHPDSDQRAGIVIHKSDHLCDISGFITKTASFQMKMFADAHCLPDQNISVSALLDK